MSTMGFVVKPYVKVQYDEEKYYIFLKKRDDILRKIIRLNETGLYILELINNKDNINSICEHIMRRYNIECEEDKIKEDIIKFIEALIDSGLIEGNLSSKEKMLQNISSSGIEYFTELDKIEKNFLRLGRPFKVFLEITYDCDLRCQHCYKQEKVHVHEKNYMKKEKIVQLLDQFEKSGVIEVFLTGGEPFKHPSIFEILQYASSKNFLTTVLTNGNILSDEENIKKIKDLNIYDIRISIYGLNKTHDSITKVIGSYKKSFDALQLLNKYMGIGTGVLVLTKKNIGELKMIVDLFKKMNIKLSINPIVMPTSGGDLTPLDLRISIDQYEDFLQTTNISILGSNCSAGQSKLRIMPNGIVIPCEYMEHIKLGNVNINSFENIINDNPRSEFISKFTQVITNHSCNKCNMRKVCNFCPAVFKFESGKYDVPSPYICETSKRKMKFLDK